MNEEIPIFNQPNKEVSYARYDELPTGLRELGAVCQDAELLGDFYSMIEQPKYDFSQVFNAVVELLVQQTDMPRDVIEKGLREDHGLYLDEDEPVGPCNRLW